ncbi:uncharacterized protein LOC113294671 [Papaver somniferum]|uniref:uncharacterized protein LOC113294671 n=1 Tax=Papaver somniferum TaxID=3469 RepID=UPI000E6FA739|nr:uncharacterized protein LOC113294671 [Papaver somniferum]
MNATLSSYDRKSFSTSKPITPPIIHKTISTFGVQEIPFTGNPFTWSNHRKQSQYVTTRLDRALSTTEWLSIFPDAILYNLIPICSDHSPILLNTNSKTSNLYKPFRLYETWTKHPTFKAMIQDSWEITHSDDHIQEVKHQPRKSQNRPQGNEQLIEQLQQQLQHWYQVKADIRFQQALEKVLQNQDRNSKVFHASVNYRRRRNQIDSIKDEAGKWYSSRQEIEGLLLAHFGSITTTSNPVQQS